MATTNYTSGTVITSAWLNDVDALVYDTTIDAKQYCAGDGVTDDYAAFTEFLADAENKIAFVPAGTYRLVVSSATAITVDTFISLYGIKGKSILEFELSGASIKTLFSITAAVGRLWLNGIQVQFTNANNADVIYFAGNQSGLKLRDCVFPAGMTDALYATTEYYGILLNPDADVEDIEVDGCDVSGFTWFLMKANTNTYTHKRIRITRNKFSGHYRTPILINTPTGEIIDVAVYGNKFQDNAGVPAGDSNCFHIALQGRQLRVSDNDFTGIAEYAMHIEEVAYDSVITGNTILMDDTSTGGIRLVNNSNSGALAYPTRTIIADNIIRYLGTAKAAGTRGILVNNDGVTADPDARATKIRGNIIKGFEYGVAYNANTNDDCDISGNTAEECYTGFRSSGAPITIANNRSVNCTYALGETQGITAKDHGIIDCTNIAEVTSRWVNLVNPYFEFDPVDVAASPVETDFSIIPLTAGTRVSATVNPFVVTSTSADTAWRNYAVTWDGTTLVATAGISRVGGGLTLTVENETNVLVAKLISTSARTNVRTVVNVLGTLLIAA